jgi:hypothetical protein
LLFSELMVMMEWVSLSHRRLGHWDDTHRGHGMTTGIRQNLRREGYDD